MTTAARPIPHQATPYSLTIKRRHLALLWLAYLGCIVGAVVHFPTGLLYGGYSWLGGVLFLALLLAHLLHWLDRPVRAAR